MPGDCETTVFGAVIAAGGATGLMPPGVEDPGEPGDAIGATDLTDPAAVSTLVTFSPIVPNLAVATGKGSPSRFGIT